MTTMLIDGNNVAIAAHFASDELRDMDGRPVAAIFGFIRTMRSMIEMLQLENPADQVRTIVLWDDKRDRLWRKMVLPSYKESRTTTAEKRTAEEQARWDAFFEQLPRLRQTLTDLGIGQMMGYGLEADDLAGWFVKNPGKYVLVTGDKDWLQLVSEDVRVWRPTKGAFVTLENFEEVTGCLDAEQYVTKMSITGDDGDDIPGAVGIGDKGAIQYVRGIMEPTTKAGKPAVKYEKIKAWMEDPDGYARSRKLIELRNKNIPIELVNMTPGKKNMEAFMNTCIHHGFESILKQFPTWTAPFM